MKTQNSATGTKSLMHALHQASQCADELFSKSVSDLGLTARQFIVLSIVAEHDDPSQTDICDRSGIDRSTLADIVARLVARGLLSRRRTRSDSRKYAVRLTENGRRCLEKAIPAAMHVDTMLTRALTAEQRSHLVAGLGRLLNGAVTGA
ncbi:MAG: MarR family winged helix-turn-helix transcriptional regulator [Hyphomicrobium sp.]